MNSIPQFIPAVSQVKKWRSVQVTGYGDEKKLLFKYHQSKLFKEYDLGANDILIKINSCALSQVDIEVREGSYKDFQLDPGNNTTNTGDEHEQNLSTNVLKHPQEIKNIEENDEYAIDSHHEKLHVEPHVLGYEVVGEIAGMGEIAQDNFQMKDRVMVLIPLDCPFGGCADFCVVPSPYAVKVDSSIPPIQLSGAIRPGLITYQAFHYHHRLAQGEFVFIHHGASDVGHVAVQLASKKWGARVITTIASDEALTSLQDLKTPIEKIIDLRTLLDKSSAAHENHGDVRLLDQHRVKALQSIIMETTGQLGVDVVLDSRWVSKHQDQDDDDDDDYFNEPLNINDCVPFMAPHSSFLTVNPTCDFTESLCHWMLLNQLKCGFLFEQAHVLSSNALGRYLHMMNDIAQLVKSGELRIHVEALPLEHIRDAHRYVEDKPNGRIVIAQEKHHM